MSVPMADSQVRPSELMSEEGGDETLFGCGRHGLGVAEVDPWRNIVLIGEQDPSPRGLSADDALGGVLDGGPGRLEGLERRTYLRVDLLEFVGDREFELRVLLAVLGDESLVGPAIAEGPGGGNAEGPVDAVGEA